MTNVSTAPPFDPECAIAWRAMSDTFFGGGGLRVNADTLTAIRASEPNPRALLLTDRPFTDREVQIPGPAGEMTLSLFTPDTVASPAPAVYWIHGGGMVAGTRFGAGEILDVAATVGGVVASIEYRLAPEHPAPAPVDDAFAGLGWFAEHATDFGVDPSRIILAGASAGGGVAAATALRVRDEDGPTLAGLMLCCPMLDDRMLHCSSDQFDDNLIWTRANNEFGWRSLLGERFNTDGVTIYEAPGRATELSGLPPTFIDVGSADLFRDEDVAFASTIWASGGDAELHVWPGGYHAFEALAPKAALTIDAFEARCRWFVRTLAKA